MLSGRKHWITVGLALLLSAGHCYGQYRSNSDRSGYPMQRAAYAMNPMMGGMQDGGVMHEPMSDGAPMGEMPANMAFEGPPPMDYAMSEGGPASCCDSGGCDTGGCDGCGPGGLGFIGRGRGCMGCGGVGCANCVGGRGMGLGGGCGFCGGGGCLACGWNRGCLLPGGLLARLLGSAAPYSEGAAAQRWFDISAGTIALARESNIKDTVVTSQGISGPRVLSANDVDLNKLRYGLALTAALQVGPGGSLEATYFGLNRWNATTSVTGNANLFSVYSNFGTAPPNGFDDTDRSLRHTVSYSSAIHNGEVNFRRRWVGPTSWLQGSWLAGIRYFDLDEHFAFNALGENNNAAANNGTRFFEHNTATRNQLTGFQIGGDLWMNLMPGIHVGVEAKSGIYGNHAETEANIFANSIPLGRELLSDGKTAFVTDFAVKSVYRLTYSWSLTSSYNLLYLDNVALAAENYNVRDINNIIGLGSFTNQRRPFIDTDGEVFYTGYGVGAEYTW